jgi:hypothetical protein
LYMAHYGMGHGQVDTKTIAKVRRFGLFLSWERGGGGEGNQRGGGDTNKQDNTNGNWFRGFVGFNSN